MAQVYLNRFWDIFYIVILLEHVLSANQSYNYEKLNGYGLGKRIIYKFQNMGYPYPEKLPTKKPAQYVRGPYTGVYQGARNRGDRRVYNKNFQYPPKTMPHHLYCEGVFDCKKYVVSTDRSGDIHVHVQGDLSQQDKRCVFLTVHDLGTNHTSMVDFVNTPAMSEIKERSCFIHVDVPGHEENSPDLPESYPFPSLQTLGEDLITVLDFLHVRYAVGLGEGAGANVLARCGIAHPRRLLGLILVNCTGSTSSVADAFRTRFSRWRGTDISQSEEDFLIYHKFGHQISSDSCEAGERERMLAEYRSRLRGNLNTHNIKQYVRAFIHRKDLVLRGCQPDILLITGMLSPYAGVVEKMYKELDKERVTILKVDRAGDVLAEAPAKVAQSLLLFCQGQSQLTSLPPPGVERRMSRAMSMEEYDKPNIRRLSLTPQAADAPHRKL